MQGPGRQARKVRLVSQLNALYVSDYTQSEAFATLFIKLAVLWSEAEQSGGKEEQIRTICCTYRDNICPILSQIESIPHSSAPGDPAD